MKKEIQILIFSTTSYTNENIKQFMEQNKQFSFEDYGLVCKDNIYNVNAEKVISFLSRYDNGYFCPEKCNVYEPISEVFDPNNMNEPIRWLSHPGSAFYFKKRKDKISGAVENNEFCPVWMAGEVLQPVVKPPYFKSYIKLSMNEDAFIKKGINYWSKFLNDLSLEVNVSFAFVDYWENIKSETELCRLSEIENFKIYPYQINYFNKEFMKLINIDFDIFNCLNKIESESAVIYVK